MKKEITVKRMVAKEKRITLTCGNKILQSRIISDDISGKDVIDVIFTTMGNEAGTFNSISELQNYLLDTIVLLERMNYELGKERINTIDDK